MVVDILAPLRMRRRCWGAFISTPYCRAAPTRVSATNLEPAGQLQFLIRTGIVKYAKSESHLYIIESYKTSRPLFRHGGGSAGDNSRSPSFIYTRSIQINIFFFNVASVFVFIYLCPIFKTVLVYTRLGNSCAAFTIHDSRQLLASILESKDRRILPLCLPETWFWKKEKRKKKFCIS